jgi:hypothetical protein
MTRNIFPNNLVAKRTKGKGFYKKSNSMVERVLINKTDRQQVFDEKVFYRQISNKFFMEWFKKKMDELAENHLLSNACQIRKVYKDPIYNQENKK